MLRPVTLQQLLPLPEAGRSNQEWSYLSRGQSYNGTFQVGPSIARAEVDILTFAELRKRIVTVVATIDYEARAGEGRNLAVRLRNWEGGDVQLDAPYLTRRPTLSRSAMGRTWQLELQPPTAGRHQIQLTGTLPLESATGFLMPDVSVSGVSQRRMGGDRWARAGR